MWSVEMFVNDRSVFFKCYASESVMQVQVRKMLAEGNSRVFVDGVEWYR